jgi:formiminotetrahydrofolate cyclodeaminase
MREFCDFYIIQVPFDNVIKNTIILEFTDEFVEWGKINLSSDIDPGAVSMHEYVEFWFKDKADAMKVKLTWG